jgi:hypothetical protein
MFPERDFDANPYSADELRVVEYIASLTGGTVGAGDDPISFLIASHSYTMRERRSMIETWNYLWRWVERGLFDRHHTPKEALNLLASYPTAPWNNGRWDVDHKDYGEAFYKAFPKAKGNRP